MLKCSFLFYFIILFSPINSVPYNQLILNKNIYDIECYDTLLDHKGFFLDLNEINQENIDKNENNNIPHMLTLSEAKELSKKKLGNVHFDGFKSGNKVHWVEYYDNYSHFIYGRCAKNGWIYGEINNCEIKEGGIEFTGQEVYCPSPKGCKKLIKSEYSYQISNTDQISATFGLKFLKDTIGIELGLESSTTSTKTKTSSEEFEINMDYGDQCIPSVITFDVKCNLNYKRRLWEVCPFSVKKDEFLGENYVTNVNVILKVLNPNGKPREMLTCIDTTK